MNREVMCFIWALSNRLTLLQLSHLRRQDRRSSKLQGSSFSTDYYGGRGIAYATPFYANLSIRRGTAIRTTPLPAYSRAARTHTSGVLTRRLYSHALRGFVVLTRLAWARCSRDIRHARRGLVAVFSHALRGFVVLTRLAWVRCCHTPCLGSLCSRYPSRPAWSRRGLPTRLAWARCSSRGVWWSQRRSRVER